MKQERQELSQYFTGRQKIFHVPHAPPYSRVDFEWSLLWCIDFSTPGQRKQNIPISVLRKQDADCVVFMAAFLHFAKDRFSNKTPAGCFPSYNTPTPTTLGKKNKKKNNRRCRRIYAGTISERLILTDEFCRNKNMMQPFFPYSHGGKLKCRIAK